jgi:hypothetical protein
VLMTPDDLGHLKPMYQQPHDPPHEKAPTGQPRLNVIFEAGMAMGRCENRTIIVEVGSCRPFSDTFGRHVVRMDGSMKLRQDLAVRLEAAGCPVNRNGSDWHTEGDFHSCLGPQPVRRGTRLVYGDNVPPRQLASVPPPSIPGGLGAAPLPTNLLPDLLNPAQPEASPTLSGIEHLNSIFKDGNR